MTILVKKHKNIKIFPRVWKLNSNKITLIGNNNQLIEVQINENIKNISSWFERNGINPYMPVIVKDYFPTFNEVNVCCTIISSDISNYYKEKHINVAVIEIKNEKILINDKSYLNFVDELSNFEKYNLIVVKNKGALDKISNKLESILSVTSVIELEKLCKLIPIYAKVDTLYSYWKLVEYDFLNILEHNYMTFESIMEYCDTLEFNSPLNNISEGNYENVYLYDISCLYEKISPCNITNMLQSKNEHIDYIRNELTTSMQKNKNIIGYNSNHIISKLSCDDLKKYYNEYVGNIIVDNNTTIYDVGPIKFSL